MENYSEELKSANEELMSVNEELQSANEELETSQEELQSANEELITLNTELQAKVAEILRTHNDMNNLLSGTGIATIFLDHQLRILRFTPTATQITNLILSDVGRPIRQIVSNLVDYDSLISDIQSVLDTLKHKEVEVQTTEGTWYLMRIQPYVTIDNVIDGAVINFVDISENKKLRDRLQKANAETRMAMVVRDAYDAITLQDLNGAILAWNPGAERMYGWSEAEALMMNIRDRIPERVQHDELVVIQRLSQAENLEPYSTERLTKSGAVVEVWLTATALMNEAGVMYAIVTTERARESTALRNAGGPQ